MGLETIEPQGNQPTPIEHIANRFIQMALNGSVGSGGKLTEGDFASAQLEGALSVTDYIINKLQLENSIQLEAFRRWCATLPPPVDTREVLALGEIFTPDEELAIRQIIAGCDSQLCFQIDVAAEDVREDFTRRIALCSSPYTGHAGTSLDPKRVPLNRLNSVCALGTYTTLNVDGKRCFALHIPQDRMAAGAPDDVDISYEKCIADYLIVTSPELNSELSTYIFQNIELVQFCMSRMLLQLQTGLASEVLRSFEDIARKKKRYTEAQSLEMQDRLQYHAFTKLLEAVQAHGGIYITHILRNAADSDALRGREVADNLEMPSEEITFKLSHQDGVLIFERDDEYVIGVTPAHLIKGMSLGRMVREGDRFRLEYTQETDALYTDVKRFFDSLIIINKDRLRRGSPDHLKHAHATLTLLLETSSAAELFARMFELEVGGYPKHQIIVSHTIPEGPVALPYGPDPRISVEKN
jgi:hypothetical protein